MQRDGRPKPRRDDVGQGRPTNLMAPSVDGSLRSEHGPIASSTQSGTRWCSLVTTMTPTTTTNNASSLHNVDSIIIFREKSYDRRMFGENRFVKFRSSRFPFMITDPWWLNQIKSQFSERIEISEWFLWILLYSVHFQSISSISGSPSDTLGYEILEISRFRIDGVS